MTNQFRFLPNKELRAFLIHLLLLLIFLHVQFFSIASVEDINHTWPSTPTPSRRICLEYRSFHSVLSEGRFTDNLSCIENGK